MYVGLNQWANPGLVSQQFQVSSDKHRKIAQKSLGITATIRHHDSVENTHTQNCIILEGLTGQLFQDRKKRNIL